MKSVYILRYPNGNFMGIDDMSGGYPYPMNDWTFAYHYDNIEDAQKVVKIFNEERFTIWELSPVLTAL